MEELEKQKVQIEEAKEELLNPTTEEVVEDMEYEGVGLSLWTKRCAAFGHTVWGCYYINFGGKLIYTARLWVRILRASEAIWAAILAQMPQNFSHMYLHMSSNRYVSRFYEQSSRWPKLMTINSTAQPIETHGKLAGVFP